MLLVVALQVQPHSHQLESRLRVVPALHYPHQCTGVGRLHSSKAAADRGESGNQIMLLDTNYNPHT
jgi:hypothetical protein